MTLPPEATIPAAKCACGHWSRADEVTSCRFCSCTDHRPAESPYQGHDPQTPPGAEAALQSFSEALEPAQAELAEATDAETEAELAYENAKRALMLSDECPKIGAVVDGRRITVAYVDAWIGARTVTEEREWKFAKATAKAAAKRLAVIERQGSLQQSRSRSVAASYQGTGDRW
jgi:hypothetical protein